MAAGAAGAAMTHAAPAAIPDVVTAAEAVVSAGITGELRSGAHLLRPDDDLPRPERTARTAGRTRSELERQLADSPIQLRDIGWTPTDDNHRHDRRLYCLSISASI